MEDHVDPPRRNIPRRMFSASNPLPRSKKEIKRFASSDKRWDPKASAEATTVPATSNTENPSTSKQPLGNDLTSKEPIRRLAPPTVGINRTKKQATPTGDAHADELIEKLNRSLSRAALTQEQIRAEEEEEPVLKYYELLGLEDERIRLNREANEEHDYYREKDERALIDWRVRRAKAVKEKIRNSEESRLRAEREAAEAAEQIEREAKEAAARAKAEKAAERKAAKAQRIADEARAIEEERLAKENRLLEEAAKHDDPDWLVKQKLIRPLDPEWKKKVEDVMEIKNRDSILTQTVEGTDIRRSDIETVVASNGRNPWLNDEIVNGIISAIVARKQEMTGYVKGTQNVPAYAAFPSMWYNNVTNKGMRNIENWSRRKGIKGEKMFGCEKIYFPVNTGQHWMLLIISPKVKAIEVLDSLDFGTKPHTKMFALAREWLQMELGKEYVAKDWIELLSSRSAQQQNSDDCGVFTCFNALASAKGREFEEVGEGSMVEARRILAAVLLNGGFKDDFEL